jgi:tetratricopeptide (TPR) repeat protein
MRVKTGTGFRFGWLTRALVLMLVLLRTGETFGQEDCGDLRNAFGPWDYTNPSNAKHLKNVNDNHFNSDIRNLVRGQSSGHIGGDLDYILRAFPNHHLALDAISRLSVKERKQRPRGAQYTVTCYFDRAVRFKPTDPTVRLLYARLLARNNQREQALVQLQEADQLDPKDANIKYNLGLALFELKRYDEASRAAEQAYALGFPLDGLRKKLESVGKWQPGPRERASDRNEAPNRTDAPNRAKARDRTQPPERTEAPDRTDARAPE